jgi:4-hydroxy-3-polyprenylbenzoate decarboxylase
MLKLSRMGVHILMASPGFYHMPKTLDDIVNHIVGKTLDCMGVPNELFRRWQGGEG